MLRWVFWAFWPLRGSSASILTKVRFTEWHRSHLSRSVGSKHLRSAAYSYLNGGIRARSLRQVNARGARMVTEWAQERWKTHEDSRAPSDYCACRNLDPGRIRTERPRAVRLT